MLSQFVEELDLEDLYSIYAPEPRENQATSPQLLKVVLYAYMNHIYSSRAMETACRRDINFMYLLENSANPYHLTFDRFRSLHFAPCAERIMAEMTKFLYNLYEEFIEVVHGPGKRKTPVQRYIEKLEEYLIKLKEYTQKIQV
ncbi:transposase [Clostridium thermarum]|uniref:transposase n=1 Tax=Clostridium thermarum TaxID=1716543 RepID=UPI001FAC352E|nr:transposase [Clostridium thermarum]